MSKEPVLQVLVTSLRYSFLGHAGSTKKAREQSSIIIPENKKPEGSHWDDLKDNYKKENPDIKLMGDKFIGPNEQ